MLSGMPLYYGVVVGWTSFSRSEFPGLDSVERGIAGGYSLVTEAQENTGDDGIETDQRTEVT